MNPTEEVVCVCQAAGFLTTSLVLRSVMHSNGRQSLS